MAAEKENYGEGDASRRRFHLSDLIRIARQETSYCKSFPLGTCIIFEAGSERGLRKLRSGVENFAKGLQNA